MSDFAMPPVEHNQDGEERCVGFELELAGVELRQLAEIVQRQQGGEIEAENDYRLQVKGTEYGDFTVELDFRVLNEMVVQKKIEELHLERFGLDRLGLDRRGADVSQWIEKALERLALTVVPLEVVTPPIPLSKMATVDALVVALRQAGAEGTGASLAYAFGLHLNPEVPSLEVESLLRHLQAFLLLYDWLKEEIGADFSRSVTPYIQPFPEDYARKVLDPDYGPDLDAFLADYLDDNRTRNRPLDFLPIFDLLRPDALAERLEEPLNQARPTYHFRLPDCRLEDPEWGVVEAWNHWVEVERLAADDDRRREMAAAYREYLGEHLSHLTHPWRERVLEWLG